MGVTVAAESPLGMDVLCGPFKQVFRAPRAWTSNVDNDTPPKCPGCSVGPGFGRPHRRAGWRAGMSAHNCTWTSNRVLTRVGEPSPPARTHPVLPRQAVAPTARALTILDDRNVDRRGAGHRHERFLRSHGRRTRQLQPTAFSGPDVRPSCPLHWPTRPQLFVRRPISSGSGPRSTSQPMSGIGR